MSVLLHRTVDTNQTHEAVLSGPCSTQSYRLSSCHSPKSPPSETRSTLHTVSEGRVAVFHGPLNVARGRRSTSHELVAPLRRQALVVRIATVIGVFVVVITIVLTQAVVIGITPDAGSLLSISTRARPVLTQRTCLIIWITRLPDCPGAFCWTGPLNGGSRGHATLIFYRLRTAIPILNAVPTIIR